MYRRNRRVVPLFLAAVLALGLAACGDDDDDQATPEQPATTQPQGSPTVTIEMADYAFNVSGPLTTGGTLRITNVGRELHVVALGKLRPGKTVADVTRVLSEMGGPPGGGGEAGATTTAAVGATTTTTSSATTTSTTGQGAGQGEGEGQPDPLDELAEEVGLPGGFMSPGQAVELTVPNLQPGNYVLLCFIPTEGEGVPHFVKGMVGQLDVVAGPAPPQPTADVTYRIAPGQAPQGPATLTPGRHTLRFEAAPGSEQLEPGIAKLNPGSEFADVDQYYGELFESPEGPPRGAAARAPAQIVYGGFDLLGTTSFFLTLDFQPGNYYLVAEDTDPEERISPPRELLNIRVG